MSAAADGDLPGAVVVFDPVIRHGAYLAIAAQVPGQLVARWHVLHADGSYVGYTTSPDLIALAIARHRQAPDR